MKTLRKLFTYIRPYLGYLFGSSFLTILISALKIGSLGALIGSLKLIFSMNDKGVESTKAFAFIKDFNLPDFVLSRIVPAINSVQDHYAGKPFELLKLIVIVFLAANILRCGMMFLKNYLNIFVGVRIIEILRNKIYQKCLNMDFYFYNKYKSGDLMSRILVDVSRINTTVSKEFMRFISSPIDLAVKVAGLFLISTHISIYVFIVFPLIGLPIYYFGKKIKKISKRAQKKTADLSSIVKETLMGIQIVQAFNMKHYEQAKFEKEHSRFIKLCMKNGIISSISNPSMEVLVGFGIVGIALWGGHMVFKETMKAETFLLYMAALREVYAPIKEIIRANNSIQSGLASADRIFEILEEDNQIIEAPNAIELQEIKKGITCKNLRFNYNESGDVIQGVNLHVPVSKCVAVVGPSGSGKSTFMNLIPRFIEPQEGEILIDDTNYNKLTLKSLRHHIGLVTQNVFLFDDTIRNNITYGKEDVSDEEVIAAAKKANAHDFIVKLPNGYNTEIGELGDRLSGGERQRISIARAIMKDPSILLLDEATSSLDSESEAQVQKALDSLMENRTTITIAHRLSTIVNSDEIVFLKDGAIKEQGSHQDLLDKDGHYASFFKTQILTHQNEDSEA